MTTVVFDGNVLASDSQSTRKAFGMSTMEDHCPSCDEGLKKVHSFRNKVVCPRGASFNGEMVIAMAGAGEKPAIEGVIKAVSKGIDIKTAIDLVHTFSHSSMRCTVLVVCEKRVWKIRIDGRRPTVEEVTKFPVAIGTGANAALFAMRHLGFNAVGGVLAGIDVDESSGGAVNHIECRDLSKAKGVVEEKYDNDVIRDMFRYAIGASKQDRELTKKGEHPLAVRSLHKLCTMGCPINDI